MRLLNRSLFTLFCFLCFSLEIVRSSEVAKVENQVICPDSNPINCYPKLFQPEEDWKVVREGQIIPPGLDIKMDFESGVKEAKVSNKMDLRKEKPNHDLVVANTDPGFRASLEFMYGFADGKYGKTLFTIIDDHFNELIEWSSDRESGIEISQNVNPLLKLTGLFEMDGLDYKESLNKKQLEIIQEKTFRILSSSFQNNLEAQEGLIGYLEKPEQFLKILSTRQADESDLITKRKLGLLGTLVNNGLFNKYFDKGGLEYKLIDLYSKCENDSVRERIMTILESTKNYKRNDEMINDNIDAEFAKYVQEQLLHGSFNSKEALEVMKNLAKIKNQSSKDRSIQIDSEFLNWLDGQIDKSKTAVLEKRDTRDNSNAEEAEKDRLEQLVELRHEAFGNRLGTRRDLPDEL